MHVEKKFTAIDLFSGCGGFSYGFEMSNFRVLLGIDNSNTSLKTFQENHQFSEILNLDLSKKNNLDEIYQKYSNVDAIIAGPPCQGFSLTGKRDQDDPRNSLFEAVFLLANKIKPKAIIIENVIGLLTLYNGKAKEAIIERCEDSGYLVNYKILYAPDYGIPQIRRRVFFVALRKDLGMFEFPAPIILDNNYITTEQAISDLPSLEADLGSLVADYLYKPSSLYQTNMRVGSNKLWNHAGTKHSDHVINVIKQVPEGGNHKDLPKGVGDSRKFNEAWTRYHSKKPAKTIDTGHRNHFHYKWNRVPSVRENARLQSFPDRFIFYGNKTEQYRQVGNAVPPLLGYAIAEKLKEYLID